MSWGYGFGFGIGLRRLLIFLLVIATIFVFAGVGFGRVKEKWIRQTTVFVVHSMTNKLRLIACLSCFFLRYDPRPRDESVCRWITEGSDLEPIFAW